MTAVPPGDSPNPVPLAPRLTLLSPAGWKVARPGPAVLGEESTEVTAPLSLFMPAEPPVAIDVQPAAPRPAVLGEEPEQAALAYQPAENAVYVLLQEVHTPDGIIYDWT